MNYTDDWAKCDQALTAFEKSLEDPQPSAVQQADNGSWGPCYEEWYAKLEPTVGELQRPVVVQGNPRVLPSWDLVPTIERRSLSS
jgi:hypothetical protein